MNRQECLDTFRKLYDEHGIIVLTSKWIEENHHHSLHTRINKIGIKLENIAEEFGVIQEFELLRYNRRKWTTDRLKGVADEIIESYGCIPPIQFLKANGYGQWCSGAIRNNKSMDNVRTLFQGQPVLRYVARDGKAWRSYAEVAFANFLYARGIQYEEGKRYDTTYEKLSGRQRGFYDFHFIGVNDLFSGKRLDVEIWGGTLTGGPARQQAYSETRRWKEEFNKSNLNFVPIEFTDCYDEVVLQQKLAPYIGDLQPTVFTEPHDRLIPSTKWAILDHVIKKAKEICSKLDTAYLPAQHWFDRTSIYKNRKVDAWEDPSWSPFIRKMYSVGGLELVRTAMGQTNKRQHKTAEEISVELNKFLKTHNGRSPSSIYMELWRKPKQSVEETNVMKSVTQLRHGMRRHGIKVPATKTK